MFDSLIFFSISRNSADGQYYRYDARLLLDAPPPVSTDTRSTTPDRQSPTGWSDLSSDAEDTFFLTVEETEDYHREKRRRVLERIREERLRALREEAEEEEQGAVEDAWGGSDEEVGTHVITLRPLLMLEILCSLTTNRKNSCGVLLHTFYPPLTQLN